VGDYFPQPVERTRAMSIYMLSGPLSSLVSFAVGGFLNETLGWRWAFFLLGIPGLAVAVLVKVTLAEPRLRVPQAETTIPRQPPMRQVIAALWRQSSTRNLSIAIILLYIMGLGLSPWYAAFMIRNHGMRTSDLGVWLGLIFGVGGVVGVLSGGYVSARWFSNNEKGQLRVSSLMIVAIVPFTAMFLLLPQKLYALFALLPSVVVCNFFYGPTFSLLQRLVVDEIRATTAAVVMFLVNLVGMGVGPQVVGVMSDRLKPYVAADSLRYSMLAMSLVAIWSAYHFWCAARSVGSDLLDITSRARVMSEDQSPRNTLSVLPASME
jgi:predicted MFS family arabinose efflux permease